MALSRGSGSDLEMQLGSRNVLPCHELPSQRVNALRGRTAAEIKWLGRAIVNDDDRKRCGRIYDRKRNKQKEGLGTRGLSLGTKLWNFRSKVNALEIAVKDSRFRDRVLGFRDEVVDKP